MIPRHVPLEEVAEQLGVRPRVLVAMARRGDFPPLVRLSQRRHLVAAEAVASWLKANTVCPETQARNEVEVRRVASGSAMPAEQRRPVEDIDWRPSPRRRRQAAHA